MGLFCPKCGSILRPKKNGALMACGCGYSEGTAEAKITEKLGASSGIEVVEKQEDVLPKTPAECTKCDSKSAYYWLVQTRAGDEPETKFLKCTACGHTWRDYS